MNKVHKIDRNLSFRPSMHMAKPKRSLAPRLAFFASLIIAILFLSYFSFTFTNEPQSDDAITRITDGALTVQTLELPVSSVDRDVPVTTSDNQLAVQPISANTGLADHQHNDVFLSAQDLSEFDRRTDRKANYRVCGQPAGAPGEILASHREDANGGYTQHIVSIPELPAELSQLAADYHCLLLYNELSSPEVGEYTIAQLVFYQHDLLIDGLLCCLHDEHLSADQQFIVFEARYLNPSTQPGHLMFLGKVYSAGQSQFAYLEKDDLDSEGASSNVQLDQYTSTAYAPTADHLSQVLSLLS